MYAKMGGMERMRGYYEGRYRDKRLVEAQAELRQKIYRRHGVVAWIGGGQVWGTNRFRWSNTLCSFGCGYRFEFKNRMNIRLDYGWGNYGNPNLPWDRKTLFGLPLHGFGGVLIPEDEDIPRRAPHGERHRRAAADGTRHRPRRTVRRADRLFARNAGPCGRRRHSDTGTYPPAADRTPRRGPPPAAAGRAAGPAPSAPHICRAPPWRTMPRRATGRIPKAAVRKGVMYRAITRPKFRVSDSMSTAHGPSRQHDRHPARAVRDGNPFGAPRQTGCAVRIVGDLHVAPQLAPHGGPPRQEFRTANRRTEPGSRRELPHRSPRAPPRPPSSGRASAIVS